MTTAFLPSRSSWSATLPTKVALLETFGDAAADGVCSASMSLSRKQIDQPPGRSSAESRPRRQSIALTDAERRQLQRWVRGRTTAQRLVLRSRIVLLAASGLSIRRIAREVPTSLRTVVLWRRRFLAGGVMALLRDAPGRGRKPSIPRELREAIVAEGRSSGEAHGPPTVRAVAAKYGVSRSVVHRIWSGVRVERNSGTRT